MIKFLCGCLTGFGGAQAIALHNTAGVALVVVGALLALLDFVQEHL